MSKEKKILLMIASGETGKWVSVPEIARAVKCSGTYARRVCRRHDGAGYVMAVGQRQWRGKWLDSYFIRLDDKDAAMAAAESVV